LKDNKMLGTQRRLKEAGRKKQIAQVVRRVLVSLIVLLSACVLVLVFSAGRGLWPLWVIDHRRQIVGGLLLAVVILILLSPVLVEATSNPRTLSVPDENPYGPWLDK
jgi:hypothetical protein